MATATFPLTPEFQQELRAGRGAGQRAAQHSRVGTEGQRSTVTQAKAQASSRDRASLSCKLWQKGNVTYPGDLKSIAKPGRLHNKAERYVHFTASAALHSVCQGVSERCWPRGVSIAQSLIKTSQVLYNLYAFLNVSLWETYLLKL